MSLFFNRSVSIPRSGSIASQESYRELLCPSHVLFNPAKPLTRSKLFSLKTPMTYIQDSVEVKVENTDGMATREESGRSSRPIRNRRYTRSVNTCNESLLSSLKSYFLCASFRQKTRNFESTLFVVPCEYVIRLVFVFFLSCLRNFYDYCCLDTGEA